MSGRIDDLLSDIELLGNIKSLPIDDFANLGNNLKTSESRTYLDIITIKGKPETALSDYLFRPLIEGDDYLGLKINPQIKAGRGWVDYLIQHYKGNPVAIELKPMHVFKSGKVSLSSLENELSYIAGDNKNQIKQYLRDYDYVLLTNLKDIYYFNREAIFEFKPFLKEHFSVLVNELKQNPDLWDIVRRKEDLTPKYDLDKRFFMDLKKWYEELDGVKFKCKKEEKIVQILSKFIFIKTLEDYGLIPFNFLRDTYIDKERKWKAKGYKKVLVEFLQEIDKWCYEYYDTELFRENVIEQVDESNDNLNKFRIAIQKILGLSDWSMAFGIGLMYYNYRSIDEDIFGKAYETFLAEQRKEKGIYYTPADVTEYMSRTIVNELYVPVKDALLDAIQNDDYGRAKKMAVKLANIKIVDPACGSGSFLIKALRYIWGVYREINEKTLWSVQSTSEQTMFEPDNIRIPKEKCREVREILGMGEKFYDGRRLISLIILRHIYGIDLDKKALDVAKVNLWKEALKLSPGYFRYSTLPENVNHILPDLESNFINADTLIDLPLEKVYELLASRKNEIKKLRELRNSYLSNPRDPSVIEEYKEIRDDISAELLFVFKKEYGEVSSRPLFAPLNFHSCYFDDEGNPENNPGFDGVIGNPPYDVFVESPFHKLSEAAGTGNLFAHFIVKGVHLNKKGGAFAFIVPLSFSCGNKLENIRKIVYLNYGNLKAAHYSIRPSKIFPEAEQRTTIFFACNKGKGPSVVESSKLYRFNQSERQNVIFSPTMGCVGVLKEGFIPRVADEIGASIYKKFKAISKTIADYLAKDESGVPFYYHSVGRYWIKAYDFVPHFTRNGIPGMSTDVKELLAKSSEIAKVIIAVLNSNLFYYWWIIQSDEFHVLNTEILTMPLPESALQDKRLLSATDELMADYRKNALRKKLQIRGMSVEMDEVHPRKSLSLIFHIDGILAQHYELNKQELDFLQKYDKEFRQDND